MIGARERGYSAMLTPAGVHVVSYLSRGAGLQVQRYARAAWESPTAAEAAETLAELVAAEGGRGGRLSLAVSGFGCYHHLLSLPPAPREILTPIVTREFRRFFPDLFAGGAEPVIDFVEIGEGDPSPEGSLRELLAAAAPVALIDTVGAALERHGVRLAHWTIVPRAMQRLYQAFVPTPHTDAALVVAPGSPLLGFFHRGELRLFSDVSAAAGGAALDVEAVLEQIERGGLFVRQQFRGAAVERLFLAADPQAELRGLAERIRERLSLRVERFGPYAEVPGAMAALGAALDEGADDSLNLLPAAHRPPDAGQAWARRLGVAAALVLSLSAGWWAWSGVRAEARAAERVRVAESELRELAPALSQVRAVIDERQQHARRSALLAALDAQRTQLPDLLWPIREAAAGVEVQELSFERGDDGWEGSLRGAARGASAAEVSAQIDRLYRALAREFPGGTVTLEEFGDDPAPAGAEESVTEWTDEPIAIAFRLSFIVPASSEEAP